MSLDIEIEVEFDNKAQGKPSRVERLIDRLRQYRRTGPRFDKRATNYEGLLLIAAILCQLWFADTP